MCTKMSKTNTCSGVSRFRTALVLLTTSVNLLSIADAHSWAACIDWRIHSGVDHGSSDAFRDKNGQCMGFARKYEDKIRWAYYDEADPSRHYQQDMDDPIACSNGKAGIEAAADEQKSEPISKSYGGRYGRMTKTKVGAELCMRWPANNHATKDEVDHQVQIRMIRSEAEHRDALQSHFGQPVANMKFKNCAKEDLPGKELRCGGCFWLPKEINEGMWSLQWRWKLNEPSEWYTSCADVEITH